jgi:DNA ligase (NAD+)
MTKELLDTAAKAYYEGQPLLSDEEFDRLAEEVGYNPVGYNPDAKRKHTYPLYSLQKVFLGEDSPPEYSEKTTETPKLDGAAIALEYQNGSLKGVLTRGNGEEGVDVTDKFIFSHIVPQSMGANNDEIIQVTGELVADKSIPNARNYAAGALNLKSIKEFSSRELTFIAYSIRGANYESKSYTQDMQYLKELGFNTVIDSSWDKFPKDGKVFRVDSNSYFNKLGYTAHHPRGAYALKTRERGVETTLLDVVWQVGKSGKVTPVAILDPIKIEDARITRATLNNMAYIKSLNLEIGCQVEVIRAGKIIPCVVSRVR